MNLPDNSTIQHKPTVSIVIAAFNCAKTIGYTLDTVRAQTFTNYEIIAVDDGSSDDTFQVLSEIALQFPNLKIIKQANAGPSSARNTAIRSTVGEYVAILDSDDLWHNTKLEKQLNIFNKSGSNIGAVYCWQSFINSANNIVGRQGSGHYYGPKPARELLLGNFVGSSSNIIIRKSAIEKAGLYDETVQGSEDQLLYIKIARHYDFACVEEYLTGYPKKRSKLC